MPALSDYTAGTITLTNGSTAFTGAGTGWQAADFREGDTILGIEDNAGVEYVIATISGNGAGTLTQEWEGATGTYQYRMRYMADGARVTAQARNLIELLGNGNLQALAGLTGPGVPVFNGPHAMEIKPVTDFVNGVAYNVQVDTLADRAAYDGQSEGFAVLVSDMGDGRSALFSKASNTSGDWTDPAYITGPSVSVTVGTTTEGPFGSSPDVTGVTGAGSLQLNFELPGSPSIDATVTSLPPGTTASVVTTPVPGGYELDFELPEARGFYNAGVYDIAEAYSQDDVVRHNGSSFIALQAVPAGTNPSNSSPPLDTAYWQVLAAKGADGNITGVTPFWQGRITVDANAEAAVAGLTSGTRLGATNKIITDWNDATENGWYSSGPGAANAPSASWCQGFVEWHGGGGYGTQTVHEFTTDSQSNSQMWKRQYNGGSWGTWYRCRISEAELDARFFQKTDAIPAANIPNTLAPEKAFRRGNVLGSVSQSGGVPTGALIESGVNANGEYVKFADGTMECQQKLVLPYGHASYFRGAWTFPAAFAVAPRIFGSLDVHNGGYSPSDRSAYGTFWVDASGLTATGAAYVDLLRSYGAPNIVSGNTVTVNALAKGRWF